MPINKPRRYPPRKLTQREQDLRDLCKAITDLTLERDMLIKALHMEGRGCKRLAALSGLHYTTTAKIVRQMEGTESEIRDIYADQKLKEVERDVE